MDVLIGLLAIMADAWTATGSMKWAIVLTLTVAALIAGIFAFAA
jgi:hypothetical protein